MLNEQMMRLAALLCEYPVLSAGVSVSPLTQTAAAAAASMLGCWVDSDGEARLVVGGRQ